MHFFKSPIPRIIKNIIIIYADEEEKKIKIGEIFARTILSLRGLASQVHHYKYMSIVPINYSLFCPI